MVAFSHSIFPYGNVEVQALRERRTTIWIGGKDRIPPQSIKATNRSTGAATTHTYTHHGGREQGTEQQGGEQGVRYGAEDGGEAKVRYGHEDQKPGNQVSGGLDNYHHDHHDDPKGR